MHADKLNSLKICFVHMFSLADMKIVASTASMLAEPSRLKLRNQTQRLPSEARQNNESVIRE